MRRSVDFVKGTQRLIKIYHRIITSRNTDKQTRSTRSSRATHDPRHSLMLSAKISGRKKKTYFKTSAARADK
jgi:hypothetical protein